MSASPRAARASLFALLAACLAAGAIPGEALADESDAPRCVRAAERGQKERDEGRLVEAKATFASCGEAACPLVVRRECLRWLDEVDSRIPSVVVSVKDASGKDVVDAMVTLDGEAVPAASRGREVLVNPGPHRIAATRPGGARVEKTLVVREREEGRTVRLVLDAMAREREEPKAQAHRGVPVMTWILAGTAVAGGVSFAYLWSRGVDRVHDLRDSCAPRCSDGAVDGASNLLRASHIALGVGIAAAAGALVVYLLQPDPGARPIPKVSASTFGLRF